MYSDFIEDRLAENSEHIALLKKGIKNFTPTWLESNFRQEIKQEAFKPVDDFFDNIFQSYDDSEKLFIYKSTYSQAGFEESIKNLEKFVLGMKVEITKTTFDYTPYLKFTKQNDGTFLSEVIDNYDHSSENYVQITRDNQTVKYLLPYTQESSNGTLYRTEYKDIPNPTSGITGKALFIKKDEESSPYIRSVAAVGNKIAIKINTSTVVTYVPADDASSPSQISQTNWYWVNDEVAAQATGKPMWFLNYRATPSSFNTYLYVLHGNDTLSFEIVEQSSKYHLKLSASSPSDLNSYMLKVSDGYFCLMNPVVLFGSETPQTEFPRQEEGSSPPVYDITVSTTGEVFKDYELFQARFGYLVKELLYYYDVPTVKYNITYEINAINKEQHIIHVTLRIFKFIPISEPGVNITRS